MTTGFVEVEATEEERSAKHGLLNLVSNGKPYVLITVDTGEDGDGTYLETGLVSDMPEEMVYAVLQVASEELAARLGKTDE